MKLLTLNTHSWLEDQQLTKIDTLAEQIACERYDIIALQEVNQLHQADGSLISWQPDNYLNLLVTALEKKGLTYHWRWVATHLAYDKFDEGLALLSLHPIEEVAELLLSPPELAYDNYQRRKALGIKVTIQQQSYWFYSVHCSWWQPKQSIGFRYEWASLTKAIKLSATVPVFLLGDFNNPADITGEGYELITKSGWYDTFYLADHREGAATVEKNIAGWEDNQQAIRIDYVFCSHALPIASSMILFNGVRGPLISDHFGLAVSLTNKLT
ncbi:endonuclease/exonuclease/phosphatase family protein [Vagococcus sp. BWB3-3]|uniref:Endonuclease/exonuclease/phosphatase family protein n=1 Tax=Vagococcus allomyrinae TaxID=2794353 RepID=A0A940PBD0_9ENTE|nr:endonuclease/exonuclease/phosphatase family protein [Vagococcus allomyrinae]MBP1043021.1 endonuclease/exonuclease/phosphatase family protein [Vagococcus allomyrinae]